MGFMMGEANAMPTTGLAAGDTIAGNEPPPLVPKLENQFTVPGESEPVKIAPPAQVSPPPPPPAPMSPPPPVGTKVAAPTSTIVSTPGQDQASAFDSKFRGTPLEGKWDAVRTASEKNGISPALAASVMGQETGFGKNVKGNNPGGIMDPASNWQRKMQFKSIDEGISKTVNVIARNYQAGGGSLEGLASRYAPIGAANDKGGLNKDWLPGVKKNIAFFGGY